ncbi:hypothetical protein [Psychromonas sp. SA13A]|uniref:hypothetical protein n=1 Tax=Psychromonas sp. SA13A TaxID=2686346 RepID=UPI00140A5D9F|nr:hypothetical protein [Psychromonas sp. SA13A]
MKIFLNNKCKLILSTGFVALMLTGCGSSTQEEQLTWLSGWDSQYEAKIEMVNVCYKEAGVHKGTKRISKSQQEVINKCEFAYITEQADNDGVSLELETLKNNVMQF